MSGGDRTVEHFVEFRNISKAFPGVQALDDVGFMVNGGEVCALLGENGAGKSTLLKILSGDIRQDEGTVIVNGEAARFSSPHDAIKASISVIYQERQMAPMLSVMENVFIGDLPGGKTGIVDRETLRVKTQELIDKFSLPLQPGDIVGRLSVAHQQMVEVMKAYRRNSAVIAFDEPTSSLTDSEVNILFDLIKQLRDEGKVILYVSHRMAEIFRISDNIAVLKDGKLVRTFVTRDTDEMELITAMVGRDIGDTYANLDRNEEPGEVILEVDGLVTDYIRDISFTLRKGEILGFAGLIGAGRTEVARAIFGADDIKSGSVKLDGEPVRFKSPKDAIDHGIALCPEDRKEQGLILNRTISQNVSIPVLSKICNWLFLNKKRETRLAEDAVARYSIRTPSIDKLVLELSGGNQQKVILGRWTSERMQTKVLILDEPTKGIDVGSKAEVYQMMCDLAKTGIAVIFISSELTEVINISDRIVVMHNGHITKIVDRGPEATEESVLALAMLD